MNPLLINTSDIHGGAARAAYRLHQGMQQIGMNSKMLVQKKSSADNSVIGPKFNFWNKLSGVRNLADRFPLQMYRGFQNTPWSPQWLPNNIDKKIDRIEPDIVHLHWICGGFVPISQVAKIKQPIVWTLHDMWAFTGGCHYNGTCDKYKQECGGCQQLGSNREDDLSRWVWRRKKKYWEDLDFTVVTPSNWLADCARSSSLFEDKRIEVIPNGLDLQKYKPVDKEEAREALNLPQDKNLVLFGAMNSTKDKRKGFQYLKAAINMLSEDLEFEAIVFGNSGSDDQLDIPVNYLGRIPDNMLTSVYSAADMFVAPSLQDNLPNTVMEALACGTPSVAFDIGGMSDMIVHKENGYLAKPFDTEDMAKGMEWVVASDQRKQKLSEGSRKYVENKFELEHIARKYTNLYSEIC
ncbi:glycosyltransferase family 4 protein [Methanohalophilus mahii]|uniref:Glycosyl transferase group 1 n=1 Tax=Methanohalophilus mahii (strain ATCC 35705 / DSM 5219 / SLP) TaxID=547558 RepID=D5E8W5_METMS|nr:glycosyltransferase family 4 protein [Methanohalophilus mahii]ADE35624.1 glycosyl transferase group 1 [Methanohalophilus mahii DSM 5219]